MSADGNLIVFIKIILDFTLFLQKQLVFYE